MAAKKLKKHPLTKTTPKQAAIISATLQHPDVSQSDIARITKTDKGTVSRTLQAFGLKEELTKTYVNQRAKIYQGIQAQILSAITTEDIQKASLKDKCVSMGIIHDHERIELGQSTDKQPVLVLVRGDKCQVQIGGKVEQDASASDNPSGLVDITQDDKTLHYVSD